MILTYQLLYLIIIMVFIVLLSYKIYSISTNSNLSNFTPFIGLILLFMMEIFYLVQELGNMYVWWIKDIFMILCVIWILIIGLRGKKK